ncbi:Hypothetical protein CINCED_3A003732 [Cinara cedri]|uniref:Uncharacterized protein n=1 Tax=Cinara cedri TaxID=506608 RepID=A0A5E4M3V3_9HEMI|nr:Hypothetical protein CINCED_3A003732 [Cinara cedri]
MLRLVSRDGGSPRCPEHLGVAARHDGRLPVLAGFRPTAEWWYRGGCHWSGYVVMGHADSRKALGRTGSQAATAANRGISLKPTQSIGGLTPHRRLPVAKNGKQ